MTAIYVGKEKYTNHCLLSTDKTFNGIEECYDNYCITIIKLCPKT